MSKYLRLISSNGKYTIFGYILIYVLCWGSVTNVWISFWREFVKKHETFEHAWGLHHKTNYGHNLQFP